MSTGEKAPPFEADAVYDGRVIRVSLSEFANRWVLLFFYPKDFSFVCPTELRMLAKYHDEFEKAGVSILGVSTDSVESHKQWLAKDLPDVHYPLIADTDAVISSLYGVLDAKSGQALRGAFIIDPDGVVQYAVISNMNVGRSVKELLRVIAALKTSGMCPAGWKKGDKPLAVRPE